MDLTLREIQELDIERFEISRTISTHMDKINVNRYC